MERKTIYFDVSPFMFYVLVEADKRMKNVQHIIGYFSKEKSSDESYNLACLMVLNLFREIFYEGFSC
jgi:histone acetyltransferase MYST1